MKALTEKEKAVFEYIADAIQSDGYPPTVRDIQSALHIKSTSTVHSCIARLEEKGYVHREAGKSRSLRVDVRRETDPGKERSVKVPVVGRVAAGTPILALENCEGYIDFPVRSGGETYGQLFALRVKGDSMIGAGILNGDIVVVSKTNVAENGDIVVALTEDEATVKRFFKEKGHFRLQPENPDYEPIILDDVYILGKVTAVVRYYKK